MTRKAAERKRERELARIYRTRIRRELAFDFCDSLMRTNQGVTAP